MAQPQPFHQPEDSSLLPLLQQPPGQAQKGYVLVRNSTRHSSLQADDAQLYTSELQVQSLLSSICQGKEHANSSDDAN